jgi:hypothetical protein
MEKLVPTQFLRSLIKDSQEEMIESVRLAVQEEKSKFVGENTDLQIRPIATFSSGLVRVMDSSGKFYEAKFENRNGKIKFSEIKNINVPIYDSEEVVDKLIEGVIDGLFNKDMQSVRPLLNDLVGKVAISPSVTLESAIDFSEKLMRESPWMKYFLTHRDKIAGIVHEDSEFYEPKYGRLISGEVREDDLEVYSAAVGDDLKNLLVVLNDVAIKAKDALEKINDRQPQLMRVDDDISMGNLKKFAEDFNEEVWNALSVGKQVNSSSDCVLCKAVVHDALAVRLNDYSTVGRMLEKVTS